MKARALAATLVLGAVLAQCSEPPRIGQVGQAGVATADVFIDKADFPDPVAPGGSLTYNLYVGNNGPDAVSATVMDTLPPGVMFQGASPGVCTQIQPGQLSCSTPTLQPNAPPFRLSIFVQVVSATVGSVLDNTATVMANNATDPDPSNNTATACTRVVAGADLTMTKIDTPNPAVAGELVTSTITVTNNGPEDALDVRLFEQTFGAAPVFYVSVTTTQGTCTFTTEVNCRLGNIANGATVTITITLRASSAGTFRNSSFVDSTRTPDPDPNNNFGDVELTVTAAAGDVDVSVTKTASPDPVTVGQDLVYTITVTNAGPDPATTTLRDNLPFPFFGPFFLVSVTTTQGICRGRAFIICFLGDIPSGGSATVTITITPLRLPTQGTLSNFVDVATAQVDRALGNNSSSTVTMVQLSGATADVSVTKSDSPDPVLQGSEVTYTATVTTDANVTGVSLEDELIQGFGEVVSFSITQGACEEVFGTILCRIGNMTAGQTVTFTVVFRILGSDPVINEARVESAASDTDTSNNVARETTTVTEQPACGLDVSITKSDAPDPVQVDMNLTYTMVVANSGPGDATNVMLSDPLPAGVDFVSVMTTQGTCGEAGGTVTCNLGTISPGPQNAVTVTVVVTPRSAGTLTNTASIIFDQQPDVNPNNDQSTATTDVQAAGADLMVTKSDDPDPVFAGAVLTYTIDVTNLGPGTASSVLVTDNLPAGVTNVNASGTGWVCNVNGTNVMCSLSSLTPGPASSITITVNAPVTDVPITINNPVTVGAASPNDPDTSNNSDNEPTDVNPLADLSIDKTDSPDPVLAQGTLTYTLAVSNAGPSAATSVTVTDTLPGTVTFVSASGMGWTCGENNRVVTCTRPTIAASTSAPLISIVVTAPAQGGTLPNAASVTSATADPNLANNSDSEITTVTPVADLSMDKSDSADPVGPGANFSYTLLVSNAGPSVATSVSVTDTLPGQVTFVSAGGTGWTCNHAGGVVTCTRASLAVGAAPPITIAVTAPTEEITLQNTASVATTANDPNTANNSDTEETTVAPEADVAVTKVDAQDPVNLGASITYTITVTNNGPSTATNVALTDTLPAGTTFVSATPGQGSCAAPTGGVLTCALGTLSPSASTTVTVVVTATTGGTVTNSVSVAASQPDPTPANNSASETTVVIAADLAVTKTDAADPVNLGNNVTYTVTVQNNGPSPATNVTVTDTLPAGTTFVSATPSQGTCGTPSGGVLTCDLGTLASGASATVDIVVTPGAAGTITNTVSASASEPDPNTANNSASQETTITAADLAVTKTDSPDPVPLMANLTYTVTVTNNGPSAATGVTLDDDLPPASTFVSAAPSQGTCGAPENGLLSCALGTLASGASATVTIVVRPTAVGTIANTAFVLGNETDTNLENNSATAATTVTPPMADVAATKVDAADPVGLGENVVYTATATNNGPSLATNVTLSDTLPAGTTFVSATPSQGTCTGPVGGVLTCSLGSLAPGGSATVAVVVTPTAEGTITNVASVSASEPDPDLGNNSDSEATVVEPRADLGISKSDSPDPVDAISLLDYTLTVSNVGPSTAQSVQVADNLPAGVSFVGASGTDWTCTEAGGVVTCTFAGSLASGATAPPITVTVTAPAEGGMIANTATVSSETPDPVASNNTATESTTVVPRADLSITKEDAPDPVSAAGRLTYTLAVRNDGPSTAANVRVTDVLPAGVAFVSASGSGWTCNAAGRTVTCTRPSLPVGDAPPITLTVTAPPEAGTITNPASVEAQTADPDLSNNSDEETTTVTPAVDLAVTKIDEPDPVTVRLETITYTITVTNQGPGTATNVRLTDLPPASVVLESLSSSRGSCQGAAALACSLGTMAPGDRATIRIVGRPTATGIVENTATVSADESDTNPANNTATARTTVLPFKVTGSCFGTNSMVGEYTGGAPFLLLLFGLWVWRRRRR